MNTPMGSVGTFVGDGTANFAGNGGLVAAGVGQVGFAGQGIGFNQGFGSGQINGVGNVRMGRWGGLPYNPVSEGSNDQGTIQGEGSNDQGEGSNEQEENVRMGRWGTNLAYLEVRVPMTKEIFKERVPMTKAKDQMNKKENDDS